VLPRSLEGPGLTLPEIGEMFAPDSAIGCSPRIWSSRRSGGRAIRRRQSSNDQLALVHDHRSVTMLSKVAVLSALSVAIYSKKPEAWNLFYVTVAIATLRVLVNLIAVRRQYSKLVIPPNIARLMPARPTALDAMGPFEMAWRGNGKEALGN
jgi:hypothetical protein